MGRGKQRKACQPTTFIEGYPVEEMVNSQGTVTDESFRCEDRLKAKYPLMYTLMPVE